jgi:hypothetical protein
MNPLRKVENVIRSFMGPANVMDPRARPATPPASRGEILPGGYVRRGTPGNYYIVKTDDAR